MNSKNGWLYRQWQEAQLNAPPFLERTVLTHLHDLKEIVRLSAKPYMPVHVLTGYGQGGPLTASFVNVRFARQMLEDILFIDEPEVRESPPIPFWQRGKLEESLQGDLVVVEAPRHLVSRLQSEDSFTTSEYIHHSLDVSGDWPAVRSRFRQSIRRDILPREVRDGYDFVESKSEADFQKFFFDMYLPTMENRHGRRSSPASFETGYNCFQQGHLLLARRKNDWVAGGVCLPQQGTLVLYCVGVRDGDPSLIREEAIYMVYLGAIRWANAHGYKTVSFTNSSPFMETGLFQNKRKWGGTLSIPRDLRRRLWIKVQNHSPAVATFLEANPMITVDKDGILTGLIHTGDTNGMNAENYREWQSRYMTPGLTGLAIRSTKAFGEPDDRDLVFAGPLNEDPRMKRFPPTKTASQRS